MPDRDVDFQITAHDKTGPATERAADGFEHLGREADKAKRKIDDLGDESGHLARKLAEARAAAVGLAREFDRTGESKILKDFQKINAEANKLGRVMKTIKIDDPKIENPNGFLGGLTSMARKAGLIAGDAAVDGWMEAFKALPPDIQAMIAVAGVGAVAAFEGAILGAVATGGIATGLILGAQDDRVKAAYAALGTDIMGTLKDDAKPFAESLLTLAPDLRQAFDFENPRLKRIFAELATDVRPIVDNIIAGFDRIGPALERASATGGKWLISLSSSIPALSASIGSLLDSIGPGAEGSVTALNLLILTVAGAIQVFSYANLALNPFLIGLGKLGELTGIAGNETHKLVEHNRALATSTGLTAEQYAKLSYDLGSTVGQAHALQEAFDRLFNEQMSVDQANLAVNAGLLTLKETIKDNKKTLDEHTQSGVENNRVILQQVQYLQQQRQAAIDAGNGTVEATQQANAAYVSQLEGLRKLLYSLGLNKAQVDALIDSYERLAQPQTKIFTTVYRTVGTKPGQSDEATGHSRTGTNDYGALDGWAPARFNAAHAEYMASSGRDGGGSLPHMPPVDVHTENSFVVTLDGQPFRQMTIRTTRAAEKRAAWRTRVGSRDSS